MIVLLSVGCTSKPVETPADEELNVKRLAVFYGRYLSKHQGQPPKTADELRSFIKTLPSEDLEAFKVTDVDKLFVSPRDGQPYVIVSIRQLGGGAPGSTKIVAYEQTGKDGKRWVAYSNGGVEEIDETKFNQLLPKKAS